MARRKEPVIPDAILDQLLAGGDAKSAFDGGGLIDQLKKTLAERALNTEMDHHLSSESGGGKGRQSQLLLLQRLIVFLKPQLGPLIGTTMKKIFKPSDTHIKKRIFKVSDIRRQEIADFVAFWKHVGPCKAETAKLRDDEMEGMDYEEQMVLAEEMEKQGVREDWLAQFRFRRKFITP